MTSTNNPVAFPPISMIPCIYGLRLGSICDIFVSTSRLGPPPPLPGFLFFPPCLAAALRLLHTDRVAHKDFDTLIFMSNGQQELEQ